MYQTKRVFYSYFLSRFLLFLLLSFVWETVVLFAEEVNILSILFYGVCVRESIEF